MNSPVLSTEISIEQFRETVKMCLNVEELTLYVLNKLIAKIEIGCLETVDSEKQQGLCSIGRTKTKSGRAETDKSKLNRK